MVSQKIHVPVPPPVCFRIAPISLTRDTNFLRDHVSIFVSRGDESHVPMSMVTDGMQGVMASPSGLKGPTRLARQRDFSQTGTSRELVMTSEPTNDDMVPPNIVIPHNGIALEDA